MNNLLIPYKDIKIYTEINKENFIRKFYENLDEELIHESILQKFINSGVFGTYGIAGPGMKLIGRSLGLDKIVGYYNKYVETKNEIIAELQKLRFSTTDILNFLKGDLGKLTTFPEEYSTEKEDAALYNHYSIYKYTRMLWESDKKEEIQKELSKYKIKVKKYFDTVKTSFDVDIFLKNIELIEKSFLPDFDKIKNTIIDNIKAIFTGGKITKEEILQLEKYLDKLNPLTESILILRRGVYKILTNHENLRITSRNFYDVYYFRLYQFITRYVYVISIMVNNLNFIKIFIQTAKLSTNISSLISSFVSGTKKKELVDGLNKINFTKNYLIFTLENIKKSLPAMSHKGEHFDHVMKFTDEEIMTLKEGEKGSGGKFGNTDDLHHGTWTFKFSFLCTLENKGIIDANIDKKKLGLIINVNPRIMSGDFSSVYATKDQVEVYVNKFKDSLRFILAIDILPLLLKLKTIVDKDLSLTTTEFKDIQNSIDTTFKKYNDLKEQVKNFEAMVTGKVNKSGKDIIIDPTTLSSIKKGLEEVNKKMEEITDLQNKLNL